MEKVELNDKHLGLRIAGAVFFLIVGASALAYAISGFFTGSKGWREVGTLESDGVTCAQDFTFMYDIGSNGSVSTENRELTELYSHAAKKAYEQFSLMEIDGATNLWTLNQSPNVELTLDPLLYDALEKVCESGDRTVFLGPVYEIYNGLFKLEFKENAADYDPVLNPDIAELFKNICLYAADPSHISLEPLGGGRLRLNVSREYQSFMQENELTNYVDFCWLKNAFIIDYFAEEISSAGYRNGTLSSRDGYSISLGGEEAGFTVFHRLLDGVYPLGVMRFTAPRSVVYLRDYIISSSDLGSYIELENGEVRTPYLDPADGVCKSSTPDVTAYSDGYSCSDIALKLAPIYCAESFDETAAKSLTKEGIYLLYGTDSAVYYTGGEPPLTERCSESEAVEILRAE